MNNLTYLKLLFMGLILSILVAVASFSLVKFFENKTLGLINQNTLDNNHEGSAEEFKYMLEQHIEYEDFLQKQMK